MTAAHRLLDLSPRPTAIFASNDEMAAGVVFAARERGIAVPEELSVIGFDDTPIAAHIWPPLTTVRWPIVSMARAAARKLIHDMVGRDRRPAFDAALDPRPARFGGAAALTCRGGLTPVTLRCDWRRGRCSNEPITPPIPT